MNVEIKHMPALRVATVRHVGPYSRISEAFGRLGDIAGRAGLFNGKPTMLAVYHDDPQSTPEPELRSDAAIVVADNATIPEGMGEETLPAGRYASTLHVGPYEQLGDAWGRLMGQWLPQSGERGQDGDSYEIYLNNPTDVPKHELRTELYISHPLGIRAVADPAWEALRIADFGRKLACSGSPDSGESPASAPARKPSWHAQRPR